MDDKQIELGRFQRNGAVHVNGAVRRKRLSAMDSVQGNVEYVSPPRPHCLSQSQLHNQLTTNPSACQVLAFPWGSPFLSTSGRSLRLGALLLSLR